MDKLEIVLAKINSRVKFVGHESQTLPHLHEILALATSIFEKVNTETARLGLIKRKLKLPPVQHFTSGADLSNQIVLMSTVAAKLFKVLL